MKLVTYRDAGQDKLGAVIQHEATLLDLQTANEYLHGEARPCFAGMPAFLEAGPAALEAAARLTASAPESATRPLSNVRLRAPVPRPNKLFCLAGNYQDHIEEEGSRMAEQDTQTPRIFTKPPSTTVIGPGDAILIPPVARAIDWEGELAVIIGRRCKAVRESEALACVAGYTIMNDVSERQLMIRERTQDRPKDLWFDWLNGKWFDTSAPQGPWLVTTDEITDPHTLEISTYVNGERKQHNNTGKMLYRIPEIIAYLSAFVTLEPGDLISTGTIAGVGASSGTFLQPGDEVKVTISRLGELVNPVQAEPAAGS